MTEIYAIRAGVDGPVKIGVASSGQARLKNLQTGSSAKLSLIGLWDGDASDEKRLHELFAERRVIGEWFRLSDEDTSRINLPQISLPDPKDRVMCDLTGPHSLRALRRAADLTQQQVAASVGVHPTTVHKWERGIRPMPVKMIKSLAALFGVGTADVVSAALANDEPRAAPGNAPTLP